MDAFFAAIEQRDNPLYRGKPVVVGADPKGGRGRGVVSTCSYEARAFGIHSAMPISIAYRKCPGAIFLLRYLRCDKKPDKKRDGPECFGRDCPDKNGRENRLGFKEAGRVGRNKEAAL